MRARRSIATRAFALLYFFFFIRMLFLPAWISTDLNPRDIDIRIRRRIFHKVTFDDCLLMDTGHAEQHNRTNVRCHVWPWRVVTTSGRDMSSHGRPTTAWQREPDASRRSAFAQGRVVYGLFLSLSVTSILCVLRVPVRVIPIKTRRVRELTVHIYTRWTIRAKRKVKRNGFRMALTDPADWEQR